jgi:DNA-binding NtrC family response regulator
MSVIRILLLEGHSEVRRDMRALVSRLGFQSVEAADQETADRYLASSPPMLTIVGGEAMAEDCLKFVRRLRIQRPDLPVLFFPAESSEPLAIQALKARVTDYIKQPDFGGLETAIANALGPAIDQVPFVDPAPLLGQTIAGPGLALDRVRRYIRKVAAVDCMLLITGETGTGKDLVAQAVHYNSARRLKPFVVLNCAAIPDDLVESELFGFERGAFTGAHAANSGKLTEADGGTVFLDEIGELNAFAQAKLLRVIENKEVQRLGAKQARPLDIRIIAATNQDLKQLAAEKRFRQDLFFRLNVAHCHIPPLRDRREDIPTLVQLFLQELNGRMSRRVQGLSPQVMDVFMRHSWPGNVRELKNLLEGLLVNSSGAWIDQHDLPDQFHPADSGSDERTLVLRALQSARWNKSKAAQTLNWSRMTLYRKMTKYEIPLRSRRAHAKAAGADRSCVAQRS